MRVSVRVISTLSFIVEVLETRTPVLVSGVIVTDFDCGADTVVDIISVKVFIDVAENVS